MLKQPCCITATYAFGHPMHYGNLLLNVKYWYITDITYQYLKVIVIQWVVFLVSFIWLCPLSAIIFIAVCLPIKWY